MARIKELQKAATLLRQSNYYVKNKESNHHSRFNLVVDKDTKEIEVFNAEKGNDTFFWDDFCLSVANALGLSSYIHIDKYGTGKLAFHIY